MMTSIRAAKIADIPEILRLAHALAEHHRKPDDVNATEDDLVRAFFPDDTAPTARCLVAEREGAVVGSAVWFVSFSTWTGQNGIWLEDLFIDPTHRGQGTGRLFFRRLAEICLENGWTHINWEVAKWNTPSIAFYRAIGSTPKDGYEMHGLDREALAALGDAVPR